LNHAVDFLVSQFGQQQEGVARGLLARRETACIAEASGVGWLQMDGNPGEESRER